MKLGPTTAVSLKYGKLASCDIRIFLTDKELLIRVCIRPIKPVRTQAEADGLARWQSKSVVSQNTHLLPIQQRSLTVSFLQPSNQDDRPVQYQHVDCIQTADCCCAVYTSSSAQPSWHRGSHHSGTGNVSNCCDSRPTESLIAKLLKIAEF